MCVKYTGVVITTIESLVNARAMMNTSNKNNDNDNDDDDDDGRQGDW